MASGDHSVGRDVCRQFRGRASSTLSHETGCRVCFSGEEQLEYVRWRQADKIEVRFRGHKGDQDQTGSVSARTRDEVSGPPSGYRADGGAVALLVVGAVVMSCNVTR